MLHLATEHRCTLCWLPNFAFQFMARRVPAEERSRLDLSSMRAWLNCSEPVRAQSMQEFCTAYTPSGLDPLSLHSTYAMAETTFAVTQSNVVGASPPRIVLVDREAFRTEGRIDPVSASGSSAVSFVSSGTCLEGNEVRIVG